MRLVAIVIIVVMLAVGYGFLLRQFDVSAMPMEQQFGIVGREKPAAQIYIEVLSIDALNDAMQMRVSLATSRAPRGQRPATPDRDLRLMITHDKTVEEIKIAANDHGLTNTFEVDLNDGSVADYPLDVYRSDLRVRLVEGVTRPDNPAELLPAKVTVWEGLLGFQLEPHEERGSAPGELWLSFKIHRSGAFALFAFAAYGAMIVLGISALAIGILTLIDVGRPEATLIGALAGIAFALPVLRNALPGAPPLGVRLDMLVFLWTELAAVFALGLLVFNWACGERRA